MQQDHNISNEPWLRGTLLEVPAVPRAVLHALQLAQEDLHHWAGRLTDHELNQGPFGIVPVAFHLRHIARSLDRLLTYAEGHKLSPDQLALLRTELTPAASRAELFEELRTALNCSAARVRLLAEADFGAQRHVGRNRLPTTLGGLLVHIADHTQRHVGQTITTAKVILASRPSSLRAIPELL